jgi:DNA polymerase-3 subunit delta'
MPHAYIFAGAEGIGKFKTACEWAKLLLCKNPLTENGFSDSCSSCQSCQKFDASSHPDFNHIYKELLKFTEDNKDKKTPVDLPKDVIREFLIDKVSARPNLSQRKVFIISEAERLNAFSQNALLKALEEPPAYCCIILLCTRMEKLLPTTKSRCQIIRFGPIDEDRIIDKLKETGLNEKKSKYFARLAQGSLGQACRWAQLELADATLYQTKKELLDSLSTYEYADSLDLAQWLLQESKSIAATWANIQKTTSKTDINRRAAKTLVQIIISALHDAMKLNIESPQKIINFDQKEQIKKIAKRFNSEQTIEKINEAYKTIRWIDSSVNEKLIFEQLLLNLATSDIIKI